MAHVGIQRGGAGNKIWSHPHAFIACFAADEHSVQAWRLRCPRRNASPGADTGIYFICLVANIKRQFEFVQSAWLIGSKFAGLTGESDPLLGHRLPDPGDSPTDGFSIPQADGPDRRLTGLPQFVTVQGGAYFFLPGIRALRYLATAR